MLIPSRSVSVILHHSSIYLEETMGSVHVRPEGFGQMLFTCVTTEEIKVKKTPYLEATMGLKGCCGQNPVVVELTSCGSL